MAALVVTLSSACGASKGASTDGPLAADQDPGISCLQKKPGEGSRAFTLGMNVLRNTGDEPVSLGDVSLLNAKDARVGSAWIVKVQSTAIGDGTGFPSEGATADAATWATRQPVEDTTIPPHGEGYNLVIELKASSAHPSTAGTELTYSAQGKTYRWVNKVGFEVKDACE